MLAGGYENFHDAAGNGRIDIGLHFHGFESEKFGAAFHRVIRLHGDTADDAGSRSGYVARIGGIGFGMRALDDAQGAITDVHFAGLAVQLKK